MERLYKILDNVLEHAVTATGMAFAAFLVLHDWRSKPMYPIAAILVGTIVGITAQRVQVPLINDLSPLITAVATVTAPMTLVWLHKRSIIDVASEVKDKLKKR